MMKGSDRGRDGRDGNARERILQAAARLLAESGGEPVSTRAVLAEAGVGAPTLYHHFGDKQGLLDAVVAHGFAQYVARSRARPVPEDPMEELRRSWDGHVEFGLANPAFYVLMYGSARPGQRPAAADEVRGLLLEALERAARAGLLRVPPETAARMVLAACVGVTLTLITDPAETADDELPARTRDAVLAAVTTEPGTGQPQPAETALPALAIALGAALGEDGGLVLSPGERALLGEWLQRLES
jgi:AcrR family transcriptional regulator